MGLEGQRPPAARMSHPDVGNPQDTSDQDTRNQEADQEILFLFIPRGGTVYSFP